MMRRIHEAHTSSEHDAAAAARVRERLADAYGRTYSIYLIGWDAVRASDDRERDGR